ncbi:MAG: hypothetical protein G01um10148_634 [Parcubacteria group bacterium Gr01-1014_8]|nr:MAG: hypothetical protein G01um10148_634 [Parcubacteria group bacterium Gr01-1014_8]
MQAENSSDPTVYFLPGLGLSYTTYKGFLESLYNKGKSFFAAENVEIDQFGSKNKLKGEEKLQNAKKELAKWKKEKCVFSDAQVKRAIGSIEMLENLAIPQPIDVIAHSAGAVSAVLAATLRPELFRKIFLYAPAGMIEGDDPLRLKTASINFGVLLKSKLRQLGMMPGGEHDKSFLPSAEIDYEMFGMQQTMRGDLGAEAQIDEVAVTYVAPMVRALIEKGVRVSAGIGDKDHLYPSDLLGPALKENKVPYFVIEGVGHYALGTRATVVDRVMKVLSE